MAASLLTFDNAVFRQFAFYSGVIIVKTMTMSLITGFNRMSRNGLTPRLEYFTDIVTKDQRGKPTDRQEEKRRHFNVLIHSNEEDLKLALNKDKNVKVNRSDPTIERIRRCHLNDLENVIPFVLIGLLYVTTNPDPWTAVTHFRVFAASRLLHTVAYLFSLPQPSRAGMFTIGILTTLSMAVSVFRNAEFFL